VVAGKTGTAQNHEDAWFVGYSEYYTTAVWLGDPDEKRTIRLPGYGTVFGGELPAKIWGDYMNVLHTNLEPRAFAEPEPYGGSSYLKVKGEIDYCDFASFEGATGGTELVDVTGDGRPDCFRPITTAPPTTAPEPSPTPPPKPTPTTVPPPDEGDGQGNGADD